MRYTSEGVPQTLSFNKPPVSITCIFEAKLIISNPLKQNFFLEKYATSEHINSYTYPGIVKMKVIKATN